jgi:hypothetical protein
VTDGSELPPSSPDGLGVRDCVSTPDDDSRQASPRWLLSSYFSDVFGAQPLFASVAPTARFPPSPHAPSTCAPAATLKNLRPPAPVARPARRDPLAHRAHPPMHQPTDTERRSDGSFAASPRTEIAGLVASRAEIFLTDRNHSVGFCPERR